MTTADIVAQLSAGKLTPAEATKMLEGMQKQGAGMLVKFNQSGGVYVKHPSFKAISKEGKPYVAGINLDRGVAQALFGDASTLEAVRAAVVALLG